MAGENRGKKNSQAQGERANALSAARLGPAPLTDGEFLLFQRLLHKLTGITLGDNKKALVAGRLQSRLRHYGLSTYREYYESFIGAPDEGERKILVDALTTHETSFFREIQHFDFLSRKILPAWKANAHYSIWSAACSTGEEAYSLAMVLASRTRLNWDMLATDISHRTLEQAARGVYPAEAQGKIPEEYLKRYCFRGVRSQSGKLAIARSLKERIRFQQHNLMAQLSPARYFDLIVLRNTLIYFSKEDKAHILNLIQANLKPGGYLFIGHSESLLGAHKQLKLVEPAVYLKV